MVPTVLTKTEWCLRYPAEVSGRRWYGWQEEALLAVSHAARFVKVEVEVASSGCYLGL